MTTLKRPRLPNRRQLQQIAAEAVPANDTLERVLVLPGVIPDDRLEHARFDESILDSVAVRGGSAEGLQLRHVEMAQCDWANVRADGSSWFACVVDGSKLTGTHLNQAVMKDVRFSGCRANLVQLQGARLQRVIFESCDLRQAYFDGAEMPGVIFDACDLTGADFSHADIAGADLRRSRIEDIRIAPGQLSGVIVTQDQALYLAGLLGLDIREA